MQFNANNHKLLMTAALFVSPFFSSSVLAVDLVGVHDLAIKNDPQLQAAAYRRPVADAEWRSHHDQG